MEANEIWVKDARGDHSKACLWKPDRRVTDLMRRMRFARYLYETGRLDEWNVERPALEPALPQHGSVVEAHG